MGRIDVWVRTSDDWRMILGCDNIKFKFLWIVKSLPKGKRAMKWEVMDQAPRHEEMWLRVSDLPSDIVKALDEAPSSGASVGGNPDNM